MAARDIHEAIIMEDGSVEFRSQLLTGQELDWMEESKAEIEAENAWLRAAEMPRLDEPIDEYEARSRGW